MVSSFKLIHPAFGSLTIFFCHQPFDWINAAIQGSIFWANFFIRSSHTYTHPQSKKKVKGDEIFHESSLLWANLGDHNKPLNRAGYFFLFYPSAMCTFPNIRKQTALTTSLKNYKRSDWKKYHITQKNGYFEHL